MLCRVLLKHSKKSVKKLMQKKDVLTEDEEQTAMHCTVCRGL